MSRAGIEKPYWRGYAPDQKIVSTLSFEGGALSIKGQGYGASDGSGELIFKDDEADWADDPESLNYRVLRLPKSELAAIRDHINLCLGPYESAARRERIRDKIMARVEIDAETGCWIWTGPTSGDTGRGKGYPRMTLDGATVAVHIAMWIIEHGPIPPRKQIDHKCRRRLCVNPWPDHTELVTHKQNQRRRDKARRQEGAFACERVTA